MQPSKQTVNLEPLWKDPHAEISAMALAREVKGTLKEIQERPERKVMINMSSTHDGFQIPKETSLAI